MGDARLVEAVRLIQSMCVRLPVHRALRSATGRAGEDAEAGRLRSLEETWVLQPLRSALASRHPPPCGESTM
jgi:hypothetical protein